MQHTRIYNTSQQYMCARMHTLHMHCTHARAHALRMHARAHALRMHARTCALRLHARTRALCVHARTRALCVHARTTHAYTHVHIQLPASGLEGCCRVEQDAPLERPTCIVVLAPVRLQEADLPILHGHCQVHRHLPVLCMQVRGGWVRARGIAGWKMVQAELWCRA